MSNKELNNEQKNDFLTALLKFIKKIYSQGDQNGLRAKMEGVNNKLDSNRMNNEVAKELIADHNAVLSMTQTFIEDNKDKIESLIDSNKLSDIKSMIKEDLISNIDAHFSSKDISDDALSHPLRRVDDFRHEIIDNVNSAFKSEFEGMDDILSEVSDIFDRAMSEPSFSHNEALKKSPRMERSKEISKETEREMTAEYHTNPDMKI